MVYVPNVPEERKSMIKIRVSYEHPEELERLINRLGQDVRKIKTPRDQEGKFRKVYIELKPCG